MEKKDANAVATSIKLPLNILSKMENSFDQNFSNVDIHPNSEVASMGQTVNDNLHLEQEADL